MVEHTILDNNLSPIKKRRRKLLPVWIKIFLWMFMIFGFIAPIGIIFGILGIDFNLALYGIETTKALSITGIILIILFTIKGTVSFGLWFEKNWAVNLAIIDATFGILACIIVMIVLPFLSKNGGFHINLRLELIALIPYLLKMKKIKNDWENRG